MRTAHTSCCDVPDDGSLKLYCASSKPTVISRVREARYHPMNDFDVCKLERIYVQGSSLKGGGGDVNRGSVITVCLGSLGVCSPN